MPPITIGKIKRLKVLESENQKLKRLVADQDLGILALNDILKNYCGPK